MNESKKLALQSKLGQLFCDKALDYQVIILPELYKTSENSEEYVDTSESIFIYKTLKSNEINVASAFDLGKQSKLLERRGGDIWFGKILIIDTIVIPFVINLITNFISNKISKRKRNEINDVEKIEVVHLEMSFFRNGQLSNIKYEGDSETIKEILGSIDKKETE